MWKLSLGLSVVLVVGADDYWVSHIDCGSGLLGNQHYLPSAPSSAGDCVNNCYKVCTNDSDLTCLHAGDTLAGCYFELERNFTSESFHDRCEANTISAYLETHYWSSMKNVTIDFHVKDGLQRVFAKNSTDCSAPPESTPQGITCSNTCDLTKWLGSSYYSDVHAAFKNPDGNVNLTESVTYTVYTNMYIYGEGQSCIGITDPGACMAAGCFYCNNLDAPTPSGYTGCGVSPSECSMVWNEPSTTSTTTTTRTPKDVISNLTCGGIPTRFQYMHAQDLTDDFGDDLYELATELQYVLYSVLDTNSDSVFGLSNFRDRTVGERNGNAQQCYELNTGLTNDRSLAGPTLTKWIAYSGEDAPEDSWSAAWYSTVLAGWKDPIPGVQDRRILTIHTSDGPHYYNDGLYFGTPDLYETYWKNASMISGPFQYNDKIDCTTDYPEFERVAQRLIQDNVYLILLVSKSEFSDDIDTVVYWHDLIQQRYPDLQYRTVIAPIESNSTGLFDVLTAAISKVNCEVAPVVGSSA